MGILGVRRPWRKRGLGLALLLHSFSAFHRRGQRRVSLGVDAGSLTGALRLYERAGSYTVRLTVTDDRGASAETTLALTIALRDNQRPTAVIAGPEQVELGEAARFDGHASSDEDGEVVAWEWDFGDGTQAEGAEVEHTWEEPGTYSVTLWVTDDAGALFGASQVVEVLAPPLPLIEGRKMQESCACRVAGTPPGQVWWLLGALLLLGRRRIRGR